MVALSVSISARMSPVLTLSPSCLSHLARLPFSMVGDSAGMRILIGIGSPCFAAGTFGGAPDFRAGGVAFGCRLAFRRPLAARRGDRRRPHLGRIGVFDRGDHFLGLVLALRRIDA